MASHLLNQFEATRREGDENLSAVVATAEPPDVATSGETIDELYDAVMFENQAFGEVANRCVSVTG
jgi:hypothetical protein